MSDIKPFDFSNMGAKSPRSFIATGRRKKKPEEPMIPEPEVKQREEAAYQRGLQDARQTAAEESKAAVAAFDLNTKQVVESIHAQVDLFQHALFDQQKLYQQELSHFAASLAKKASMQALEENGTQAIISMIEKATHIITQHSHVNIHVNAASVKAIDQYLQPIQQAYPTIHIKVIEDPALTNGNATITWENGGLALDQVKQFEDVNALLDSFHISSVPVVEDASANVDVATDEKPEEKDASAKTPEAAAPEGDTGETTTEDTVTDNGNGTSNGT